MVDSPDQSRAHDTWLNNNNNLFKSTDKRDFEVDQETLSKLC